jgi:hypothetical protein
MATLEASPRTDNDVDPMWTRSGEGTGWSEAGTHERGLEEGREAQGGVSLSTGIAGSADPSASGIVDQLNRVLTERGYPSVSASSDIEFALSQMVQDAQDGWICFADAEASRLLQQRNFQQA